MTDITVCIITNGTMFHDSRVLQDLVETDVVKPLPHCAIEKTYRKDYNIHPGLHFEQIIDGHDEIENQN